VLAALAYRIATHERRRLVLSSAGLGFAAMLMFVQIGFRNGFLDGGTAVVEALDGDLFLTHETRRSFSESQRFQRLNLSQLRADSRVLWAEPLYVAFFPWRHPATLAQRNIRVLAFDPRRPLLRLPGVAEHAEQLAMGDAALADRESRPAFYGKIGLGTALLGRRAVRIVGTFSMGTSFDADGNVVTSPETFGRLRGSDPDETAMRPEKTRSLEDVDIGVLRLVPGADVLAVRAALRPLVPPDIVIRTVPEMIAAERAHVDATVPVSVVFGLGAVVAFVVGMVICYQILFTDVTDHVKEFATLRAMGYTANELLVLVQLEALLLSLLGFGPSLLVTVPVYALLQWATGIPFALTAVRVASVLVTSLGVSLGAAVLAARRVVAANPADLF
jgi:putative ABC transport system permease protein